MSGLENQKHDHLPETGTSAQYCTPISRLPPEILLKCLQEAVYGTQTHPETQRSIFGISDQNLRECIHDPRPRYRFIASTMLVCRLWSNALLSDQTLWTDISRECITALPILLKRSGSADLSLTWQSIGDDTIDESEGLRELSGVLNLVAPRLKSLSLCVLSSAWDVVTGAISCLPPRLTSIRLFVPEPYNTPDELFYPKLLFSRVMRDNLRIIDLLDVTLDLETDEVDRTRVTALASNLEQLKLRHASCIPPYTTELNATLELLRNFSNLRILHFSGGQLQHSRNLHWGTTRTTSNATSHSNIARFLENRLALHHLQELRVAEFDLFSQLYLLPWCITTAKTCNVTFVIPDDDYRDDISRDPLPLPDLFLQDPLKFDIQELSFDFLPSFAFHLSVTNAAPGLPGMISILQSPPSSFFHYYEPNQDEMEIHYETTYLPRLFAALLDEPRHCVHVHTLRVSRDVAVRLINRLELDAAHPKDADDGPHLFPQLQHLTIFRLKLLETIRDLMNALWQRRRAGLADLVELEFVDTRPGVFSDYEPTLLDEEIDISSKDILDSLKALTEVQFVESEGGPAPSLDRRGAESYAFDNYSFHSGVYDEWGSDYWHSDVENWQGDSESENEDDEFDLEDEGE